MTIYTKKGDDGKTNLFGTNRRCSKGTRVFRAIGAIDELNSYLGVVISESEDKKLIQKLERIQGNLLVIGSILAGSKLRFSSVQTTKLENEIDKTENNLPVLKNFVLPGGSEIGAKLHFARSLARKAERSVVRLSKTKAIKPQILVYINRLSDYLFILARKVNLVVGEKVWRAGK